MNGCPLGLTCPTHFLLFLLWATVWLQASNSVKIIFLYASCDDQLNNLLYLMHKSIRSHIDLHEGCPSHYFKVQEDVHRRHDLSDACVWVQQDTIAIVAISSQTDSWEFIDSSAAQLNLPRYVSPNVCRCQAKSPSTGAQNHVLLETAIFEYLKDDFLHDVIILNEGEKSYGEILSKNLSQHGVRISHLRLPSQSFDVQKFVEKYFETRNMVDLSDDGRMLISLGSGPQADYVLKNLVENNMRNTRTKLLVMDNPKKWQTRLKRVLSYEVDVIVVSSKPLQLENCPVAVEFLPEGTHSHAVEGPCTNLSSELRNLGEAILLDFKRNFTRNCCPPSDAIYTFWASWPSENATQVLKPEAIWSQELGLLQMMPIDLKVITVRIAALEYSPFVELTQIGGESVLLWGVFKIIIDVLSKRLNFKYRIIVPPDGQWGNKIGPGEWDGAIGMLNKGEADMIPFLMSTPTRREAIDFSRPLTHVKYGMLVAFPSEPPRAFIFLRPYRKEVWCMLVVSAFAMSFVLYKIHNYSGIFCNVDKKSVKGLSTFSRCLWSIFGAMLNQGSVHLPTTNSARVVLASWWIAVLVVLATFSANLIAFLAFPQAKWVVKTLENLVEHKSIHLTIKHDCPVLEDFKESNIEIYRRIREIYLNVPGRGHIIERNDTDFIDDVVQSQTVFIDDINSINQLVKEDYLAHGYCRLTASPVTFSRMDLSLGFRRGSSLLKAVNDEILIMLESGVLTHWKETSSRIREECYNFQKNYSQSKITLEDLQGPFYFLAIGLVFGLVFLTSECSWKAIINAYQRWLNWKLSQRHCSIMYW